MEISFELLLLLIAGLIALVTRILEATSAMRKRAREQEAAAANAEGTDWGDGAAAAKPTRAEAAPQAEAPAESPPLSDSWLDPFLPAPAPEQPAPVAPPPAPPRRPPRIALEPRPLPASSLPLTVLRRPSPRVAIAALPIVVRRLRTSLTDQRRAREAVVMSEILGPPVGVRGPGGAPES